MELSFLKGYCDLESLRCIHVRFYQLELSDSEIGVISIAAAIDTTHSLMHIHLVNVGSSVFNAKRSLPSTWRRLLRKMMGDLLHYCARIPSPLPHRSSHRVLRTLLIHRPIDFDLLPRPASTCTVNVSVTLIAT